MPRLNEKSQEQEGGREPGAFKAGEEELKGMKGFDGLLGRSGERCLPPSAGLQARADLEDYLEVFWSMGRRGKKPPPDSPTLLGRVNFRTPQLVCPAAREGSEQKRSAWL